MVETRLRPTLEDEVEELMTWFPDLRSCRSWGGPSFQFPFTGETFRRDMKWGQMASYSLLDGDGRLAGFGQLYDRAGRIHLARLAVAPASRGQGLGGVLVRELIVAGKELLPGATEASLFVMRDNPPARACYRRVGFRERPWPEETPPLENCAFLVLSSA